MGGELKIKEKKILKHSKDNNRVFKEGISNINKPRGKKRVSFILDRSGHIQCGIWEGGSDLHTKGNLFKSRLF